MNDFFLINAIIGGLGIAAISGLLGSFVLWKNMAYFGDALSHSALLGVTIGTLYHLNITVAVMLIAVVFALAFCQNLRRYPSDTILGVLSYSALSLAILINSYNNSKMDIIGYLFGDILAIQLEDIYYLILCGLIVIVWFYYNWGKLVLYSLNDELFRAEAGSPKLLKLGFTLILAMFVAISFKIVGVLLITAMLIIPAASALVISRRAVQMVMIAIMIGCCSVLLGITIAVKFNLPTGAAIILSSLGFFIATNITRTIRDFV
jgi:zinc transport system permease protein